MLLSSTRWLKIHSSWSCLCLGRASVFSAHLIIILQHLTMRALLVFSLLLCVALSVTTAAAVPSEVPASEDAVTADVAPLNAVANRAAGARQARFSFCLSDWTSFRGSCYYLGNNPDSWASAERFCSDFGGSLASVRDIWEYNFLQRMVRSAGHTFAWIGGYYFEGEWRWEDGSVFNYENWDGAAPIDQHQCLQLNSQENFGWTNSGCGNFLPFVCQVKPSC